MLEVCVDSLESAKNAISGGADEIEICSALNVGGLTPTKDLVTEIQTLVQKLPIPHRPKLNVMIRCHEREDFRYTEQQMQVMLQDLNEFKDMGIDKFVFGALTDNLDIDEANCTRIIAAASPNKVTFHRAFDHVREAGRAAATLVGLGIHRLLTAGQQESVNHQEALPIISMLATRYIKGDELIIMPGGGVNVHNAGMLIDMGCPIVHSSCRADSDLSMCAVEAEGGRVYRTDCDVVRNIKATIAEALAEKQILKQDT